MHRWSNEQWSCGSSWKRERVTKAVTKWPRCQVCSLLDELGIRNRTRLQGSKKANGHLLFSPSRTELNTRKRRCCCSCSRFLIFLSSRGSHGRAADGSVRLYCPFNGIPLQRLRESQIIQKEMHEEYNGPWRQRTRALLVLEVLTQPWVFVTGTLLPGPRKNKLEQFHITGFMWETPTFWLTRALVDWLKNN